MNPVVETFEELFDELQEARAEEARVKADTARFVREAAEKAQPKNPFGIFTQQMFEEALQMAQFFPGVVVKTPGDTIAYNVNDPATWSNFLPPEVLEAELPVTPKKPGRMKDQRVPYSIREMKKVKR